MPIFKLRTIPLSSIIRFSSDDDPFNLVDITSDVNSKVKTTAEFLNSAGTFVYETRFTINEPEAQRSGITGIRFEFFPYSPSLDSVALKENDFTVDIKQPAVSQQPDPLNIQKAVLFLKSPALQNLSQLAPSLKAVSLQQPLAATPFKELAKSSETLNKKDPAQSLSAGKTLGMTPKNILNFGVQSSNSSQKSQNFDAMGSKSTEQSLSLAEKRNQLKEDRKPVQNEIVNSFLNLKRVIEPNSLVRTLPVAMVEVLSKNVEYTRQFKFDKSVFKGANKIYVRISGVVRNSVIAKSQKRLYIVPHFFEVSDFIGNPEPPVILSSESSFGKASFVLRRNDPTLRRVNVVRIIKNPNAVNATFENVVMLEFGDKDTVELTNSVDNVAPNTVIYRFVVLNEDGSSGEFSSTVLTSFTKVSDQKKVLTSTTPISIRAINTVDGISIDVDTINDQVYSLRLLRQDLGLVGEFSSTVKTILDSNGRYSQIVAGEKRTLSFLDTDVIPGRHYRYFAAYRLGTGAAASLCQETISDEDEAIVRLRPSTTSPFTAALTPATTTQDQNNALTVSFDMQLQETQEQYNVLLDALRQAGVSQQFISDLQNDRQKIKQVAAFLVERVDRVTGRRVSFGIFPSGKFSDSPESRNKLGLPEPIPGRKYEYICKLCIRPDKTFLLTATVGFTATNDTTGNITEVIAAKFQNSLIGRGILPSEKQLRDGISIRENFFLGLTGLEISNTTTIPNFAPKVENLTVKQRKFYNLIKWGTSGDISNVSYFLIYCNYNGNDELLGSVSAIGSNAIYQYKDERFCDEVGEKSYFVKIVTLDHDVSIPSPKVETVTEFSIPAAVLDGFILSPSRYEVKGVVLPGPGPSTPNSGGGGNISTGVDVVGIAGFGGGTLPPQVPGAGPINVNIQDFLKNPVSVAANKFESDAAYISSKFAPQPQVSVSFPSVKLPSETMNPVISNIGGLSQKNYSIEAISTAQVKDGNQGLQGLGGVASVVTTGEILLNNSLAAFSSDSLTKMQQATGMINQASSNQVSSNQQSGMLGSNLAGSKAGKSFNQF